MKTEWSGDELELFGNELLRPEAIERLEIIYKSSMDVDTTLSELSSVTYNCAQKSEWLNNKINVNFFDNEYKVKKKYLEALLEAIKNYSSSEENHELLLIFKEKRRECKRLIKRKKWQKLREEQKKLEQAFNLGNTKDFWSKMKKYDQISQRPRSSYLESIEGECIESSKENWSDFVLFPMREKDYDLVREVSSEEIRKVVRNMKGRSGPSDDYLKLCLQVNIQKSKVIIFNKRNEKDYDLVREVSSEEIRKVVSNMKGRSGPSDDYLKM